MTIIISDGRILDTNLVRMGLDRGWLAARLKEHGVDDASQVFLMSVNTAGQVYFAGKELHE